MAEIHVEISEQPDLGVDVAVSEAHLSDMCLKIGDFSITVSDGVAQRLWAELDKWFNPELVDDDLWENEIEAPKPPPKKRANPGGTGTGSK